MATLNDLVATAADLDRADAELARMRAALLNIQAMAERGFPVDHAKLATQCRESLGQQQERESK